MVEMGQGKAGKGKIRNSTDISDYAAQRAGILSRHPTHLWRTLWNFGGWVVNLGPSPNPTAPETQPVGATYNKSLQPEHSSLGNKACCL